MTIDQAQTADYRKTIRLRASASDVFDALTTVTGLSSWWTRTTDGWNACLASLSQFAESGQGSPFGG